MSISMCLYNTSRQTCKPGLGRIRHCYAKFLQRNLHLAPHRVEVDTLVGDLGVNVAVLSRGFFARGTLNLELHVVEEIADLEAN